MLRFVFLYVFYATIMILAGCRNDQAAMNTHQDKEDKAIHLSGTVQEGAGMHIIIEKMGAREFIPLDTVQADESGNFTLDVAANDISFYALRSLRSGYLTLLAAPGENIRFEGNYNAVHPYAISGSPGSELIQTLASRHKTTVDAMAEVSKQNRVMVNHPDYADIKPGLDKTFDSLATDFYEYSLKFIHQNASSLAILIALHNQYGYGLPVFTPEFDLEVFQFVDSALHVHYPENESVQMLHAQLAEQIQRNDMASSELALGPGDLAPDFVMNDRYGNPLALSDLRGKYVFLSFWAAWSRPSREENSYLKQAAGIFPEEKFVILQVSIDDNEALWKKVIEEEALNWYHVSDLKRWDSKVNDLYALDKIPSNFLVSPQGSIVKKDVFGDDLIPTLKTLLE